MVDYYILGTKFIIMNEKIIIVGGGPVGITAAISLAKMGKDIVIFAELNSDIDDGRVIALSYASFLYLKDLGCDFQLQSTPITQVHVSHNGFGINNILAKDVGLEHLGYTIKYSDIVTKLCLEAEKYPQIKICNAYVNNVISDEQEATVSYFDNITKQNKQMVANLVILAEGGNLKIPSIKYKLYNYEQNAIIARINPHNAHQNIAYERFEQNGAMALLPNEEDFVLVWAIPNTMRVNSQELDKLLHSLPFMKRFGGFDIVSDVVSFPLHLRVAQNKVLPHIVLIGNSSQIVHPISAQGLNLGLRDVQDICQVINNNLQYEQKLDQYIKMRSKDVNFVSGFTHGLARFLEVQNPIVNHIRGFGLFALNNCKMVQNKLTYSLIFGV